MDNYYNSLPKGESSVVLVIDGVDEAFEDDCREFLRLVSDVVHSE
jgi:hypothetical protein